MITSEKTLEFDFCTHSDIDHLVEILRTFHNDDDRRAMVNVGNVVIHLRTPRVAPSRGFAKGAGYMSIYDCEYANSDKTDPFQIQICRIVKATLTFKDGYSFMPPVAVLVITDERGDESELSLRSESMRIENFSDNISANYEVGSSSSQR